MALKDKRKRFAHEYMVDLNGTAACIRAGYPEKSARSRASKLLDDPEVQSLVQKLQAEQATRCAITADMVLAELAKIGFANMADYIQVRGPNIYVDLTKMNRDQAAAVSEITVEEYVEGQGKNARDVKRTKFKLSDKRAALCDIGKHLGMFRENPGGDDVPMPTKVVIEVVDGRKRSGD